MTPHESSPASLSTTPTIRDTRTLRRVVTRDRLRVYEYLTRHDACRVGEVADALAIAVGSASLHLRILHEEGFIEPAEVAAHDRRSSYWRAVPGGIRFELTGDHEDDPQYEGAVTQAQALLEDRRTVMSAQWRGQQSSWSHDWLDASADLDTMLQLDSAQAAELSAEVMAVIKRWKEARPGPASQTVFVTWACFPVRRTDGTPGGHQQVSTRSNEDSGTK